MHPATAGPGPPRPPPSPPPTHPSHNPVSESAMQMFPFNPSAPAPNLPLHIPSQDSVPPPPPSSFDTNEPFANDPFLANMSRDPPQPSNTTTNPSTQPTAASRDFFGDLESAFAIPAPSQPQPSSQDDPFNNVLDDALTLPNPTPPSHPLHQSSQPPNPHPSAHQPPPFPSFHYSSAPAPSAPAPLAPSLVPQHHRYVQPPSSQTPHTQNRPHPQQPARLAPHQPPNIRPQQWQQQQHQAPVQQQRLRQHPPQHPYQTQQHLQHLQQLQPQLPVPHSQTPLPSRPQHILPHQQPSPAQAVSQQSLPQTHPASSPPNSTNPTAAVSQVHPRPVSSISTKVMDPSAVLRSQGAPGLMYRPESFSSDGGVIHPSYIQPSTMPGTTNVASAMASPSTSVRTQEGSSITPGKKKASGRKHQRRPRKGRGSAASSPAHSMTTRDSVAQQQQNALGVQPGSQIQSRILPQQMAVGGNKDGTPTQELRQGGVSGHVGQELRQSPQQLEQIRQLQTRFLMQQQQQQQQRRRAVSAALGNGRQGNSFPAATLLGDAAKTQQFDLRAAPQAAATGAAESNGVSQMQKNEMQNFAKFDTTAIESALARTTDPKGYAALRHQVEILRNVASRGMAQVRGTAQDRGIDQGAAKVGRIPAGAALAQRQHHHGLQRQQQQQVGRQPRLSGQQQVMSDHVQGAGQALPTGLAYRGQIPGEQVNDLNPHANRSVASLPQHIQHQIQAQIQARHIHAQLQGQTPFSKQRRAQGKAPSVPASSSNPSAVLSAGLAPVDERVRKSVPKPAVVGRAQANGTMAPSTASNMNPYSELLTTSMPSAATSGPSRSITGHGRRRAASQTQGPDSSQMSQEQMSVLQAMSLRKKEESEKLEAERKRFAIEAQLRDVADRKKRRLANAPGNDLSSLLSPDYWTPFLGVSDAWQRLVPYHILLSKNPDRGTGEKWSAEVESLCEKYRTWLRALKGKFNGLCELDYENVAFQCTDYGTGALSNDDCIAMEQVLLEDAYETARKERALAHKRAQEIERRQAIDAQARKLAVQGSVALAVAQQNAMMASQTKPVSSVERRPEYSTNMYGVSPASSNVPVTQRGTILSSQPGALAQISTSASFPINAPNAQSHHRGRSSNMQTQRAENPFLGSGGMQGMSGTRISSSGSQPSLQNPSTSIHSGIQYQAASRDHVAENPLTTRQALSPSAESLNHLGVSHDGQLANRSLFVPSSIQEKQSMLSASRPMAGQQVSVRDNTGPTALNQAWNTAQQGVNDYSADLPPRQQQPSRSIPMAHILRSSGPMNEGVHKTLGSQEVSKIVSPGGADAAGPKVSCGRQRPASNDVGVDSKQHVTGYPQNVMSQAVTTSMKGASGLGAAQMHNSRDTRRGLELGANQLYQAHGSGVTDSRLPSLTNVQQSNAMQVQSQMTNETETAPIPVPVLKSQLDGQQDRDGEFRSGDPPSALGVPISPQKDKADDGILSGQVGLQGWPTIGLSTGEPQQRGGASKGTETATDNGNKERRGMGMGSLLNSEGN